MSRKIPPIERPRICGTAGFFIRRSRAFKEMLAQAQVECHANDQGYSVQLAFPVVPEVLTLPISLRFYSAADELLEEPIHTFSLAQQGDSTHFLCPAANREVLGLQVRAADLSAALRLP